VSDQPAPIRVGVRRAGDAHDHVVLATVEARVVRTEVERRLGAVSIDLRTDGPPIGPWHPLDHGAWPGSIDLTIDLADAPHPLATLFARTIDPAAAAVRRRMLAHLSVLPGAGPISDDAVAGLLPAPAQPTDVWLVVEAAGALADDDSIYAPLIDADDDLVAELDQWFDTCASELPAERRDAEIARLLAQVADLTRRLAEADSDARRSERDAAEHIDDLVAELAITRERLTRSTLDAPST